jgi:ATP-dependent DNA ligase
MRYTKYHFIYPPYIEKEIKTTELGRFDTGWMYQPKLNGSCCVVFINGEDIRILNRHDKPLQDFTIPISEIKALYNMPSKRKGWLVLVGEYMNKSQKDENNLLFNHKLVLFDILVFDCQYLVATTFQERYLMMTALYGKERHDKPYLTQITDNIYKVVSFEGSVKGTYDFLTMFQIYDGVVGKKKNGVLEFGDKEKNTIKTQIKVCKSMKNYE